MPREFMDFDEAIAEDEPIRFKIAGRDFEVDGDVPSDIMMRIIEGALSGEQMNELQEQKLGVDLIKHTIGEEDWNFIVANTRRKKLEKFVMWFMGEIMGKEKVQAQAQAEAQAQAIQETMSQSPLPTSLPIGPPSNSISRNFGIVHPDRSDLSDSVDS